MNELIPLYREMAAGGDQFHGLSILQHAKQIGQLIRQYDVKTVLDYGSGRGDAYRSPHKLHHEWGLKRKSITLYDPAFPQYESLPVKPRDMVVCSDVLEHVPEADVPAFIGDLYGLARKVIWASVCCRPAKKTFPNTDINLHVCVHPIEWWNWMFRMRRGPAFVLVETP